jgi:hypothetical protein
MLTGSPFGPSAPSSSLHRFFFSLQLNVLLPISSSWFFNFLLRIEETIFLALALPLRDFDLIKFTFLLSK